MMSTISFLNLLFALSLAISVSAKCKSFGLQGQRVWEMRVFGEKDCGTSLGHEYFWADAWGFHTTGCFAINVSLKGINDVKSLAFQNSGAYSVKLYDNDGCRGDPFDHFPKSSHGTDSWLFPDIDGGPDGYEGFVAFRVD
ncbi:hypothetical protein BV22DRAFT_148251 [Leucogyrophana mollusca]|uniref:Uncharacterized protein n=1 Tax=Leucogyrophana mollusca TaxID=85980 RepID=A0ACB8BUS8_9AGAM|nr:hypothetical protein BV22DRAFT_148251 [Leucogyrophana mollusca]